MAQANLQTKLSSKKSDRTIRLGHISTNAQAVKPGHTVRGSARANIGSFTLSHAESDTRGHCHLIVRPSHLALVTSLTAQIIEISRLDYDFVAYLVLYALDDHADMLGETFIRKKKKQRLEVEMVNDGWPHLELSDIPKSTLKAETTGPGNDTRFLMNIVLIPYVPSGKKITVLVGWLLVSAQQMKARQSLRRMTFAFKRYAPSCIPVWMMSNEYPRPVFL